MVAVRIKIRSNLYKYDDLILDEEKIIKKRIRKVSETSIKAAGDVVVVRKGFPLFVYCDGVVAHYIIKELMISSVYRKRVIGKVLENDSDSITMELKQPKEEMIDYEWNERTNHMAWERLELDHALSWLSTLGGAFSALGDYFVNAAKMAGKISLHQFKLAMRLGDPNIQARCCLFMALSLIQQGRLHTARAIVHNEYNRAKSSIVIDDRLLKMCLGIWAKLKYEWGRRRRLSSKMYELNV